MSRLTPICCGREMINCKSCYSPNKIQKMFFKLGELEDIEEKIGVDLIIKDKVEQSYKVYAKSYGEVFICECCREGIIIEPYYGRELRIKLFYKDYGKTWALTKDELLSQNYGINPLDGETNENSE